MDLSSKIEPCILDNLESTNIVLGRGSYGTVKLVKHHGKQYAAKFFKPNLLRGHRLYDRCINECRRSCTLDHPNIVKTIGFYPDGVDLTLVYEHLPHNLDDFVCKEERQLPEYINFSILHDVAKGLSYLFTKDIKHCNLTTKNILLTSTMVGKISDCCQANLSLSSSLHERTSSGTLVYMPPEALGLDHGNQADLPEYTYSVDVFSFGVLILHIYLHELPQPNVTLAPIMQLLRNHTPLEYLGEDIKKALEDTHPLYPLLCSCLDVIPANRPSAKMLVDEMSKLIQGTESAFKKLMLVLMNYEELENTCTKLQEELEKRDSVISKMRQEVKLQGEENVKLKEQWSNIMTMKRNLKASRRPQSEMEPARPPNTGDVGVASLPPRPSLDDQLARVSNVIQDSMMENMRKIREESSVLWEENQQLKATIRRLNQRPNDKHDNEASGSTYASLASLSLDGTNSLTPYSTTATQRSESTTVGSSSSSLLESVRSYTDSPPTVTYTEEDTHVLLESRMRLKVEGTKRSLNSFTDLSCAKAVLSQGIIYMGRATDTVLSYNRIQRRWDMLPLTPVKNYALVNYEAQLTLVGGSSEGTLSKDVYCYNGREWSNNKIPQLNVARENAEAVSFGKYLIVLGGVTTNRRLFNSNALNSIEVYCCTNRAWYIGDYLPRHGFMLQTTTCTNGYLYLLYPDGWTIRYCSMETLVNIAIGNRPPTGLWEEVTIRVPYTRCGLAVYDDTLVVVAGASSNGSVYGYNPREKGAWQKIKVSGNIPPIKNGSCLQVGRTELFVCGGDAEMMSTTFQAGYLLKVEEVAASRESSDSNSSRSVELSN